MPLTKVKVTAGLKKNRNECFTGRLATKEQNCDTKRLRGISRSDLLTPAKQAGSPPTIYFYLQ